MGSPNKRVGEAPNIDGLTEKTVPVKPDLTIIWDSVAGDFRKLQLGNLIHNNLSGIGINDHHNQVHTLDNTDHIVSGLTPGHVLQALTSTTFGFAAVPGLHDSVTLAVSADVLLGLTGQALSLDTQVTKRVLIGPVSGADATPTFRVLETTDIPALAYEASGAIATHAALTTGIHGLAITAGQTLTVITGGTLASGAYAAAHDAVSLAASADVLLGLTGQALSLDTQLATYVLAGPVSGGAVAPVFRALAATDIPALAYEAPLTFSTGLNRATNTVTCTITQYTDALARAAISESVTGLDYSSATGVLSLTSGYVIPTTTQETNWGTAYSASHARQHSVTSTSDHTSAATAGQMLKADANGLPVDATNTDIAVAAAVTASHAAVTLGTANGLSLAGQELSLPTTATPTFAKLTTDSGSGIITLEGIHVTGSTTDRVELGVYNTEATGVGRCRVLVHSGSHACAFEAIALNSAFTGARQPGASVVYGSGIGGLSLCAGYVNGEIRLYTGGDTTAAERARIDSAGRVLINKTSGTEKLEVNGKIRADTAFNLNGTDGVTQAASAGKVSAVTAIAGGIVTAESQITYAGDGTYANPTSITISKGIITAIS